MPELRTTHRGSITARSTYGRCWRGLWVLAGFCFVSSLMQNTLAVNRGSLELSARIRDQEQERERLEARRRELLELREYLDSPAGVVSEARKLGYARPGEHHGLSETPR